MNIVPPSRNDAKPQRLPDEVAGRHGLSPPEVIPERRGAPAGSRRLPVGAEVTARGVNFRVWAPERRRVAVVLAEGFDGLASLTLEPGADGYFSGTAESARAGALYWYRLDDAADLLPDPASRFQPEGPMGPSQAVDPDVFAWTDVDWLGVGSNDQVLYEMHVGTFTKEGTWRAAIEQLPALAELGITIIEMMPVADFAGRFGWGYDGIDLFAPTRLYGGPDDLRAFDAAHRVGLGVILDVVYNHLGPSGNFLPKFAKSYFSSRHTTDGGDAINFDGPGRPGACRVPAGSRCVNTSSPTPPTGFAIFISTDCGSTPRRTSTIPIRRTITSWRRSRTRRGRPRASALSSSSRKTSRNTFVS